jgi:hypothetical protein
VVQLRITPTPRILTRKPTIRWMKRDGNWLHPRTVWVYYM